MNKNDLLGEHLSALRGQTNVQDEEPFGLFLRVTPSALRCLWWCRKASQDQIIIVFIASKITRISFRHNITPIRNRQIEVMNSIPSHYQ